MFFTFLIILILSCFCCALKLGNVEKYSNLPYIVRFFACLYSIFVLNLLTIIPTIAIYALICILFSIHFNFILVLIIITMLSSLMILSID